MTANHRVRFVSFAALVALAGSAASQGLIHVDAAAPSGGDGSSWSGAFVDLQDALDAAAALSGAVEIWVAAGTYVPTRREDPGEERSATFRIAPGTSLFGGFNGDESALSERASSSANPSILSGDLLGDDGPGFANRADNVVHVTILDDGVPLALLDGFTVAGGNATQVPGGAENAGGGVLVERFLFATAPGPSIRNCTFVENEATFGGAVALDTFANLDACIFRNNRAVSVSPTSGLGGAVMNRLFSQTVTMTNCLFLGNRAASGGALAGVYAGALAANCTFFGNQATSVGGALFFEGFAFFALTNCILWNNPDPRGTGEASQIQAPPDPQFGTLDSCDVQGFVGTTFGGSGSFDLDPLFVDSVGPDGLPSSGDEDLRLTVGSPCVDTGLDAIPLHPLLPTFTTLPPTDLPGHPRIVDGDGDGIPTADLGAFERRRRLFRVPRIPRDNATAR